MPTLIGIQFDITWEDQAANHAQLERLITKAAPLAGSLVVLPELCDVGFSLNVDEMAEQATGNTSETWASACAKKFGIFLQAASIQRPDPQGKATNNAVVFNPDGELVCRYEKIFPFSGGNEPEQYRGGTTINTFDWHGMIVCPLICYDLRFPELWRLAAIDKKAELFTCGASWPTPRHGHWSLLLEARAIENQAYVMGVNRIGDDPFLNYSGGSKIIDPQGEVIAQAGNETEIVRAEVDPETVRAWRRDFVAYRDTKRELLGRV